MRDDVLCALTKCCNGCAPVITPKMLEPRHSAAGNSRPLCLNVQQPTPSAHSESVDVLQSAAVAPASPFERAHPVWASVLSCHLLSIRTADVCGISGMSLCFAATLGRNHRRIEACMHHALHCCDIPKAEVGSCCAFAGSAITVL